MSDIERGEQSVTAEQKAIKKERCNYLHGHDTRIHALVYTVSGEIGELTVKEVEILVKNN